MGFDYACAACGKRLTVPPNLFETKVRGRIVSIACKTCGSAVRIDGTLPPPAVAERHSEPPAGTAVEPGVEIPRAPRLPGESKPDMRGRPGATRAGDSFDEGWDAPGSSEPPREVPRVSTDPPPGQGRRAPLSSRPRAHVSSTPPRVRLKSGPPPSGLAGVPSSEPTRFDRARHFTPATDGALAAAQDASGSAAAAAMSGPPPLPPSLADSEDRESRPPISHVTGPISVRPPIEKIGRYALFDKFATGGMATVHLGRLDGAGGFTRIVAIKRLLPHLVQSSEFSDMLLNEARLAARVRHPNVVPTLDVVASKGEVLLVLEYVHGESLSALCRALAKQRGSVPVSIATSIMLGVLQGLHAVHEATDERGHSLGLVHRDVSPQNVMVGTDGMARVLDFGIVKALQHIEETVPNRLKGKTGYMSPEQIRGERLTRASDIFAAGIVLWEMLTLRRFASSGSDKERIEKIMSGDYALPSSIRLDLPSELDDVVMRALAFDPHDRYATTREFADALAAAVDSASTGIVADWVQKLAEKTLTDRARLLAQVENWDPGAPDLDIGAAVYAEELGGAETNDESASRDRSAKPPRVSQPPPLPQPRFGASLSHGRPVFAATAASSDWLDLMRDRIGALVQRLPPDPKLRIGILSGVAAFALLLLYLLVH